ncbi:hypothetical protein GCM10027065_25650 [Rhodanobacter koreensis]
MAGAPEVAWLALATVSKEKQSIRVVRSIVRILGGKVVTIQRRDGSGDGPGSAEGVKT